MLVTDRRRCAAPAPGEVFAADEWRALEAAIAAGVGLVQLREKDLDGGPLLARARLLRDLCGRHGPKLVVNDRADVALAAGLDGVHLPGDGLPPAEVRGLLGPRALIGRSAHGPGEIAAAAGADYLIFGPVYETPSKLSWGPPQGLERLASFCRATPLPVFAVGGVNADRVGPVLDAGAAGVAVIGAVLGAMDPARVVADLRGALGRRERPSPGGRA